MIPVDRLQLELLGGEGPAPVKGKTVLLNPQS
jgi:hypothetical protein